MSLETQIALSRQHEMKIYLSSMSAMYQNALCQNGDIYDIAFTLTDKFSDISKAAILEDSRIIKILRYAIAPSISQMKFGQFFGISSIEPFETDKLSSGARRFSELEIYADRIADFIVNNLDRTRFIWLANKSDESDLVFRYAKNWTCSIAADQNAQTRYRNWRKEQQEQAIISKLVSLGYVRSTFSGVVRRATDINIGEYTTEIKVKGRTIQKADIVFRSKRTKGIALVEAKAVGVELDATKRIKECCNKAEDWGASRLLDSPKVVTVIAGFFTKTNIENLDASGIQIVWEHGLNEIEKLA